MGATFKGLRRADGRVGTRNFIALCSTVNCSATVVRHIADRVNRSGMLAAYPHIDGVIALSHGTGCGMDAIRARASRRWSACSGATPRIRTSPPRSSSGSAAR